MYKIDNNIIIVQEITNDEIINNILYLNRKNYFAKTKPCTIINNHIDYEFTEIVKKEYEKSGWKTSFPIDKLERIY